MFRKDLTILMATQSAGAIDKPASGGGAMPRNRLIRILLLGHQGIPRESLAQSVSSHPNIGDVTQHSTVADTASAHQLEPADVILVNHESDLDGPLKKLVEWAKTKNCTGRILVLTPGLFNPSASWLINNGVAGLCLKRNSVERLVEAVRAVADGETWMDTPFVRFTAGALRTSAQDEKGFFTPRELMALRLLVDGSTNKEIGARLGASESAAKGLLQRLFRKTRVRTRGQLIRVAIERYRDLV